MDVSQRRHRPPRCGLASAGLCPGRRPGAAAYTLLELQVTLVILTTGLLAIPALLAMQGRQMRRVDDWCRSEPTYYLVCQPNRWLRLFEMPAELRTEPGELPWTPPVTGKHQWDLGLDCLTEDVENRTIEVDVTLAASSE